MFPEPPTSRVKSQTRPTLRWTKSSPGARPTISFAGTRLSAQPIQRYAVFWTAQSRSKKSGSRRVCCEAQARLLAKSCGSKPWWGRVLYFDIAFFLKQDSVELSFSQIHVIKNYDPTGQAKGKNRRPDSGWSLPLTGILGGAAAGEIKGEGPLRMDQPYSRQVSTSSPSIPRIMGPHL